MTDRTICYDGAIPQTVDILNASKGALLGDSLGWAAILGNVTSVAGLACTPTGPASLQVVVGQGSIYTVNNIDSTAYGDLGTDAVTVLKQGILKSPVNLTITPPGTSGFSQNYLVQAIQQDVDGGSTVISYFNAVPPNTPFAGPGNDGLSQFTLRQGLCTVSLVAGTAATTGTQTTPPPSAGNTGLYVITVANGQSTITSGNIAVLSGAPFIPVTLPLVPAGVQKQSWVYWLDTGAVNALTIAPSPAITAYTAGLRFVVKVGTTNTGAVTLNVNGLGNQAVVYNDASAVIAGDFLAGSLIDLEYDGTNFQCLTVTQSALKKRAIKRTIIVISATGAYSQAVPAGIFTVNAQVWGAGGGGGWGNSGTACASGGSAGCYGQKELDVTPATNITGSIGAGGSGGTGVGVNGTAGGNTTLIYNSVTYTAGGGPGGITAASASANSPGLGSLTGAWDFSIIGAQGAPGIDAGGIVQSGAGGAGPLGGPGGVGGGGLPGGGTQPAGGGGGSGAGAGLGASGGAGEVILQY